MISIIILAIIQALTEFIPVSSSGHLLIVEQLTSVEGSQAIDVALHFGTLLALLVYFWPRIWSILKDLKGNLELVIKLVLTTIPAAVTGYLFADIFANDVRSLGVVIIMLAVVGLVMIFSETAFKVNPKIAKIEQLTRGNALMIGLGQTLALIPGTSRSGITILSAKWSGLSNKLAAEYSFLAGIPIIAGAALKIMLESKTQQTLSENPLQVFVGVFLAFLFGLIALKYLIRYISNHGISIFGWYRLALALVLFIIWINN